MHVYIHIHLVSIDPLDNASFIIIHVYRHHNASCGFSSHFRILHVRLILIFIGRVLVLVLLSLLLATSCFYLAERFIPTSLL